MTSNDEAPAIAVLPENNNNVELGDVELGELDRQGSRESLGFSAIEDDDKRFGSYSQVTLSWLDIKVSVEVDESSGPACCKKGNGKVTKEILKGASGVAKPGTFVAIMGASGAGKTTLLNTLAMKNDHSLNESGSILINGKPITRRKTTLLSAYVQQEDFFIGTLTVKEVLMFHATLRMGRGMSQQEKKNKVMQVMKELGLKKIQNSLCGMPGGIIRGISGGERKRLSVACELLMNPPLLFIDEPTSGLDSFMCRNIVNIIGKLAKANRTIICTIHQPTSEVFAMFDHLYLVAEGRCAYSGPCKDALRFFQSIDRPCPDNFNPADHYIFTLAIVPGEVEECKKTVDEIAEAFSKSEYYETVLREIESNVSTDPEDLESTSLEDSTSRLSTQIAANFKRAWKNVIRNPGYTRIRVFQVIVLAGLGGLAYLDSGNSQESVQDKSGLLFFLVTSITFSNTFIHAQHIPADLPIIKREYRNGMYGVLAALIPRFIIEVPYLFGLTFIQWLIIWALAGLRRDFVRFVIGYVSNMAVAVISTAVGYFIATAAGSPIIAAALTPLMILPFFLFGGLYQNEASTPYYFYPIKYASWFRYSYGVLLINEFHDSELSCEEGKRCIYEDGNAVLEYFHLDPDDIWFPNIFAIFVMALGYLGLSVLLLWLRVREKRKTIKEKSS